MEAFLTKKLRGLNAPLRPRIWDEDKMKKIKMNSCALAIIIIQGIYYESKQENVTKELNLHNF